MRRSLRHLVAVSAGLSVLCVVCLSAGADPKSKTAPKIQSAYDRLDVGKLAESLRSMKMFELLDQLVSDKRNSPQVGKIMVESKIAQALASNDLALRSKLLDEAISVLRKLVETYPKSDKPKNVVQFFRLKLNLVKTQGVTKIEPYAKNLLFLRGGDSDRKIVASDTGKVIRMTRDMEEEIDETIKLWHGNMRFWIVWGRRLEAMQREIKYRSGWVRLYRGISTSNTKEKRRVLRSAVRAMSSFADGNNEIGLKYRALLLSGRAARELGQHSVAHDQFSKALLPAAEKDIRADVRFEIVRNYIEHGRALILQGKKIRNSDPKQSGHRIRSGRAKFTSALKGVQTYRAKVVKLFKSKTWPREVDLNSTMLKSYLYEVWSGCETDGAKAKEYSDLSQNALMEFVNKYNDPAIQNAFYEIVYHKYRGRSDYSKLNSVVLMAIASREFVLAEQKDPRGLENAHKILSIILKRKDKAAQSVHPHVLWKLAFIMHIQKRNLEAGRYFMQLSNRYPEHPLAFKAAQYAVQSLHGVLEERKESRVQAAESVRNDFIKALESYVGNKEWAKKKEVAPWNFQLGEQCEWRAAGSGKKLAIKWYEKAALAYEAVPSNLPEYMQARQRALRSRQKQILLHGDTKSRVLLDKAGKLVPLLVAYGNDAIDAIPKAPDEASKTDLRIWGSEAEFLAAEILLDYKGLNGEARAMRILQNLPKRWPGTDILSRSESLKIRKQVEQGAVRQAITSLESLRKRNPKAAGRLLPLLIDKIEMRINSLRGTGADKKLREYQKNYYTLGQELFNKVKDQPISQRYRITQIYANALLEYGKADEGLTYALQCKAYDDAGRKEVADEVHKQFESILKDAKAAEGNLELLAKERKKFEALLEKYDVKPGRSSEFTAVKDVWEYYLRAEKIPKGDLSEEDFEKKVEKEKASRLKEVSKVIYKANLALRKLLKQQVPVVTKNVFALARAYQGVGLLRAKEKKEDEKKKAFREAVKYYKKLNAGINPNNAKQIAIFWKVQLGFCECLLAGYSDDRKIMKNLALVIRGLSDRSTDMGGYYARFNAIESKAKRLGEQ